MLLSQRLPGRDRALHGPRGQVPPQVLRGEGHQCKDVLCCSTMFRVRGVVYECGPSFGEKDNLQRNYGVSSGRSLVSILK